MLPSQVLVEQTIKLTLKSGAHCALAIRVPQASAAINKLQDKSEASLGRIERYLPFLGFMLMQFNVAKGKGARCQTL